jgi:hypothetical protein
MSQRLTSMRRYVIGLVALDFLLRIVLARKMDVTLAVQVFRALGICEVRRCFDILIIQLRFACTHPRTSAVANMMSSPFVCSCGTTSR